MDISHIIQYPFSIHPIRLMTTVSSSPSWDASLARAPSSRGAPPVLGAARPSPRATLEKLLVSSVPLWMVLQEMAGHSLQSKGTDCSLRAQIAVSGHSLVNRSRASIFTSGFIASLATSLNRRKAYPLCILQCSMALVAEVLQVSPSHSSRIQL